MRYTFRCRNNSRHKSQTAETVKDNLLCLTSLAFIAILTFGAGKDKKWLTKLFFWCIILSLWCRKISQDICRRIEVVITGLTRNQFAGNRTWVRISPSAPSRGYKKDIARENPDFIGVFTVLYGKISATVFVDINRSFSLYIRFLNSHTTEHPIRRQIEIKNL